MYKSEHSQKKPLKIHRGRRVETAVYTGLQRSLVVSGVVGVANTNSIILGGRDLKRLRTTAVEHDLMCCDGWSQRQLDVSG